MKDNGGRRLIIDRRRCTDFSYFPERRTLRFRRSDLDRRQRGATNGGNAIERRTGFGAFKSFSIPAVDRLHPLRTG